VHKVSNRFSKQLTNNLINTVDNDKDSICCYNVPEQSCEQNIAEPKLFYQSPQNTSFIDVLCVELDGVESG